MGANVLERYAQRDVQDVGLAGQFADEIAPIGVFPHINLQAEVFVEICHNARRRAVIVPFIAIGAAAGIQECLVNVIQDFLNDFGGIHFHHAGRGLIKLPFPPFVVPASPPPPPPPLPRLATALVAAIYCEPPFPPILLPPAPPITPWL